jgi:hypothetical protein
MISENKLNTPEEQVHLFWRSRDKWNFRLSDDQRVFLGPHAPHRWRSSEGLHGENCKSTRVIRTRGGSERPNFANCPQENRSVQQEQNPGTMHIQVFTYSIYLFIYYI